jgi:hypothetical protein
VVSSWRYFGSAAGFGFGVIWMTVGAGSAILVLLCAALGYGVVYIAERERAGSTRLRPASATPPLDEPLVDDFELDRFERHDEELLVEEPPGDEMALVSTEADYGWPHG